MKLTSITIAGFRGFPVEQTIDLDADVVVLSGANGSGKTSFFDALLWVLSGSVGRLGEDSKALVSRYSPTGEARVEAQLRLEDGRTLTVARRHDDQTRVSVWIGDDSWSGLEAETNLINLLWPEAKYASDQRAALARSLTRATYLQQDAIREFVDSDGDQDRFRVVAELVGVGRISELLTQLESAKRAWTTATNTMARDMEPSVAEAAELEGEIQRLSGPARGEAGVGNAAAWRIDVVAELGRAAEDSSEPATPQVDRLLTELRAREQASVRRLAGLRRLLGHLDSRPPEPPDIGVLRKAVAEGEDRVDRLSRSVEVAEEAAAERRRQLRELRDQAESAAALAEIGLRHLGERCPICDQEYDREATRERLRRLATSDSVIRPSEDLSTSSPELEAAERELSLAKSSLRTADRAAQDLDQWNLVLASLAADVSIVPEQVTYAFVASIAQEAEGGIERLQQLIHRGEDVSIALTQVNEARRREDLVRRLETLREANATKRQLQARREATGETAQQLILALRRASEALVASELDRIGPLLQQAFASVDPHPTLRVARFLSASRQGRGRMWTQLDDSLELDPVDDPALVLSSSQLNVLAVVLFLSLNLGMSSSPLMTMALDDPLQSLDNVNLLGLADLLRRVATQRQVLVSTHDPALADLLERKLRPVEPGQRTLRVELRDWTVDGPHVEVHNVPTDSPELRLVATG